MKENTDRFKQIYFPPPVKNRFWIFFGILTVFEVPFNFVPSVPSKWKIFVFIGYCFLLLVIYIVGMIINTKQLLLKIDTLDSKYNSLYSKYNNLNEHYNGLLEQHNVDMSDKKHLEISLAWQSKIYSLALLFVPEEKWSSLKARIDLQREAFNNNESNKNSENNQHKEIGN